MDEYTVDTIIMICKILASGVVVVGIPIILNKIMIKKGASEAMYQAMPVVLMLGLAALFWFVIKDLIF